MIIYHFQQFLTDSEPQSGLPTVKIQNPIDFV